ncbi:hypothetical protein RUND412_007269 [Rhizina undulata]
MLQLFSLKSHPSDSNSHQNNTTNPGGLTLSENCRINPTVLNPAAPQFIPSSISSASSRSKATSSSTVEPVEEIDTTSKQIPVLSRLRPRPKLWNTQCKYTYPPLGAEVNDCWYGGLCLFGHEGDEYIDEPGVQQHFEHGRVIGADWQEGTVTFNPDGPTIITGLSWLPGVVNRPAQLPPAIIGVFNVPKVAPKEECN